MTWIELYTLHKIRGYPKPHDDPDSPGLRRPTLHQQVGEFRRLLRAMSNKTLQGGEHDDILNPSRILPDVLLGIGIAGKLNDVNCGVHFEGSTATEMAKHLAWANRTVSEKQIDQFVKGERKLIPREIKTRGKVDWDAAFAIGDSEELGVPAWAPRFAEESVPPSDTIALSIAEISFVGNARKVLLVILGAVTWNIALLPTLRQT